MIVIWTISCFRRNMESKYVLKIKKNTIEEPTKEKGIWIFSDIEWRVDKKVIFTWNSLFQEFQDKEFQFLLQHDISTKLRKKIYTETSSSLGYTRQLVELRSYYARMWLNGLIEKWIMRIEKSSTLSIKV
jgi:hypothetical protein